MWQLVILPFYYTSRFRYFQGKKIISFIFGELLISALYIRFSSGELNLLEFALAQAAFWSVYESGYLHNDCKSISNELKPTERAPIEVATHYKLLIAIKLSLATFLLGTAFHLDYLNTSNSALILAVTLLVFFLHNTFTKYEYRFVTFNLLSFLRQVSVIWMLGVSPIAHFLMLFPFVLVKFLNYLWAKGYATEDLKENLLFKFHLYLAWSILIALFLPAEYWLIYLILSANQNKKFVAFSIKNHLHI